VYLCYKITLDDKEQWETRDHNPADEANRFIYSILSTEHGASS